MLDISEQRRSARMAAHIADKLSAGNLREALTATRALLLHVEKFARRKDYAGYDFALKRLTRDYRGQTLMSAARVARAFADECDKERQALGVD